MICRFCGFLNAAGVRVCASCGAALTGQPQQDALGPEPAPEIRSAPPRLQIAPLGDRFLAVVLDTILITPVFAIAGVLAASR